MTRTKAHSTHAARQAVADARRALKLREGPPTAADRPTRPSHPPKVIPGQMNIFEAIGQESRRR
jgi:hypothetical protein